MGIERQQSSGRITGTSVMTRTAKQKIMNSSFGLWFRIAIALLLASAASAGAMQVDYQLFAEVLPVSEVLEPTTATLMLAGLALAAWRERRRRKVRRTAAPAGLDASRYGAGAGFWSPPA
jgi:uncharacterized protein (TIGR03382 family)